MMTAEKEWSFKRYPYSPPKKKTASKKKKSGQPKARAEQKINKQKEIIFSYHF